MTATQAPTPGPLTAAIDMLSDARDFIDRFSDVIDGDYGTSEPNAAMVMVHEINATIDHLSAPTAPVEASGAGWEQVRAEIEKAFAEGITPQEIIALFRPQPSGETREAVARLVDPIAWDDGQYAEPGGRGQQWSKDLALKKTDAILALLSTRPLALGGQHSGGEGGAPALFSQDHKFIATCKECGVAFDAHLKGCSNTPTTPRPSRGPGRRGGGGGERIPRPDDF